MRIELTIVIAVLAALAISGWLVALRSNKHLFTAEPEKPEDPLDKVKQEAARNLARSVQHAGELFQKNLTVQALKINDELEGLAKQRLQKQIEDFTAVLSDLTTTATASVGQLEVLVDQRRKALEAGMATEVLDEKNRVLEHFYQHLSDIVAGYVMESLGYELDLSGQLPYVLSVLEKNKELIKKDLTGDY